MPTKEEVGRRVKLARFRRDMTLKEVAVRSGMSATHISEIERGRTSPTIGALERISKALGERPAHFVEETTSSLAVLTRRSEREKIYICDSHEQVIETEGLTQSVPWTMTRIFKGITKPGATTGRSPALGEIIVLCVSGMLRFTVGDFSAVLRDGDTIQFSLTSGFELENVGDEPAESISVTTLVTHNGW
jgi:transcriptional regulator with XRE-family HTH domain